MKFTDYRRRVDARPLYMQVAEQASLLRVKQEDFEDIQSMLAPLGAKREGGIFHRDHSYRVGLLANEIGYSLNRSGGYCFDQRALFFAGLLHDVGKALVPMCTLCATERWTEEDRKAMEPHVTDGFRMLRDRFDFTAHVIARHHKTLSGGYPAELPAPTQPFSEQTVTKIDVHARVLTVADVYDAMHRVNSATAGAALSEEQIQERMLKIDPLVKALYLPGTALERFEEVDVHEGRM